MPIVSNTSPILNLAIINRLELLRQQFTQILIPVAVQQELKPKSDYPGVPLIEQASQEGWLVIKPLTNNHLRRILMLDLDNGEAEAIALALELGQSQILLDELAGRAKARALGLQTIGILGVLLKAKQNGQISSVAQVMDDLRRQANFFITDKLYRQILQDAGE